MSTLEEKIREFGQKRESSNLQQLINETNTSEIFALIETRLTNAIFPNTWNYILLGFTDAPDSQNKRIEVVLKLLKKLDSNRLGAQPSAEILSRVCMELERLPVKHLVQLGNYCIEVFQKQKSSQLSWKDLLPDLLNLIIEKESITVDGNEMTGLEYKHQIINAMCVLKWSSEIITPLATMFIETPLTKDEHLQVVNKLTQHIDLLIPAEIPAFVYQLLRVCKHGNSKIVFARLQTYFSQRIYDQLSDQVDSGSTNHDFDLIETTSGQEAIDAEGTVLFHVDQLAAVGHESLNEHVAALRAAARAPESVLEPFQLAVLLTMSRVGHYEERVFELVRGCVCRAFAEQQRRRTSAWFRDILGRKCRVELVFVHVINLSENRELVINGLVNFAFVLLSVGAGLGRDVIAERQWNLGKIVLFKIVKRKRELASIVLQRLAANILTGQNAFQHIDCLYTITKHLPLLIVSNKNSLNNLLDGIVQIPGCNGKLLLEAIVPLIKISPTIRDQFILLLRKALYSRQTETRQMSVLGFLKLLTNLKISNLISLSQNSFTGSFQSGHSLFTQISINRSTQCSDNVFTNEALCLEILSILQRCFAQQVEVKRQFYDGLYDAICHNVELGVPVLDMIWLHFNQFYHINSEVLPPIKFGAILTGGCVEVVLKVRNTVKIAGNVGTPCMYVTGCPVLYYTGCPMLKVNFCVFKEPIGKLIYTIGLIVVDVGRVHPENESVVRFQLILQSICERMANCELVHFELDDGTDLSDILPESQEKLLILKETLSIYDALIAYKLYAWDTDSVNNGCEVSALFDVYLRLTDRLKDVTKPKKSESKKKKSSTQVDEATSVNSVTGSDLTFVGKKDGRRFKSNESFIGFQIIVKAMSLLHEPAVTWTSTAHANVVKVRKEFHRHLMQTTINRLGSLKKLKILEINAFKSTYGHLVDIAAILYERIVKRFDDFVDFDRTTGVLGLECFLLILNVIHTQFQSNFVSFLTKTANLAKEQPFDDVLMDVIETYEKLFQIDEEAVGDDLETKKQSLIVLSTIGFLAERVSGTSNLISVQLTDWLRDFAINKQIPNKSIATAFASLLFDVFTKFKVSVSLFENISLNFGELTGLITEQENSGEKFKLVTENSLSGVWIPMCGALRSLLEDVDAVTVRLKAEFQVMLATNDSTSEKRRDSLKMKERGVCRQLCFIVEILTNLCNCTIQAGPLAEPFLKIVSHLYGTLTALTKHFTCRSSKINPIFEEAKFERLVKLTARQLSPIVYKLILYIEESQKSTAGTPKLKKSNVSNLKTKVLKETRTIPKVVYEIEQFGKYVAQLSNKTKKDLAKYVGQGTVRDFRIMHLKEVLEKEAGGALGSDASSLVSEEVEEEEEEEPPAKKRPTAKKRA